MAGVVGLASSPQGQAALVAAVAVEPAGWQVLAGLAAVAGLPPMAAETAALVVVVASRILA